MRIGFFQVEGFQGFSNSGTIELDRGFNLIVGQNNSGKSALLRALQRITDDRHKNGGQYQDHFLPIPKLTIAAVVSGLELRDVIFRHGGGYYLPMPPVYAANPQIWADKVLHADELKVTVNRRGGSSDGFVVAIYPSIASPEFTETDPKMCVQVRPNGQLISASTINGANDQVPNLLNEIWERKLFHFQAERMNIGRHSAQNARRLTPGADNLPAVLATLRFERPTVFEKLVNHVKDILPTVGGISVGPAFDAPSVLEIRVWPTEVQERVELSFPLMSSGTGVSQVLAILTAVMTIDNATIVIDEINSFLHPAAVKALLRILQTDYAQHQYIISTHSADVIAASGATSLHMVRRGGYESVVTRLDINKIDELRDLTGHLGISLSDVLAADRMLWVEGPTEELCFPRLYELASSHPKPRGTVISAVAATGDLTRKRDRALIYGVYKKVSEAALVLAAATCLDREELEQAELDEMNREAGGRLFFLPRRHIECYLLHPGAIAAFINERDAYEGLGVDAAAVASTLERLAEEQKYRISEWQGNLDDQAWLSKVDAAKLIAAACNILSSSRITFNKNKDSEHLLLTILATEPDYMMELARFVQETVDALQIMSAPA